MNEKEYVNEKSLRFELTALNLKEKYKKEENKQEKENIKLAFDKRVLERLDEVKEELKEISPKNSIEQNYKNFLESEIPHLSNLTIDKQNKSRAGMMILLIIKNLAKKPSFAGYTNNWKDDFYSKAIENCLKYIHNFDEEKISERTGKKIKSFAYITQISYMSFIAVINERKKEEEKVNNCKSLEEQNFSIKSFSKNSSKFDFEYKLGIESDINKEFENILAKIEKYKEVLDEKSKISVDIFSYENNFEGDDEYFQDLLNRKTQNLEEYENLRKFLKITYIPKTIILFYPKGSEIKKSEILNLCNQASISIIFEETDKDFEKLKNLDKKIIKEDK